ncbi:MAG: hypothetical protein JXA53_09345, partial [Bacteroidales bacterium]|nr:hypothetical protein [Bacteroidales bacterium]
EYDTMNRLVKTTETVEGVVTVTEYFYDNAGNRFIKKSSSGTTVYLRHGQIAVALDIELYDNETEHNGAVNRYVLSGDLLAGRVTTKYLNKTLVSTEKFWYHLDHLNSTKCVTAQDGSLNVMYEYRAFGEQLKKLGEGEAKYTYGGKELDDSTNLYYFNARYYDATIGRFINVDPVQDGTNWYVYCNNNPLSFVDPTGLSGMLPLPVGPGNIFRPLGKIVGDFFKKHGRNIASTIVSSIPVVGDIKDLQEAIVGKDLISGEKLTLQQRGEALGCAILPVMSGKISRIVDGVDDAASKVLKNSDDLVGQKVYRVWGDGSGPNGRSWSRTNPSTVPDYRDTAGLPDVNSGRFVSEGIITDSTGITTRKALELDGNKGGLDEVLIPNSEKQVNLEKVSGQNPEF